MLVGNGAEMQKSFKQNRNLLRKRTFLNRSISRKSNKRKADKNFNEADERRFDKMQIAAETKAKQRIMVVMIFLAMGLYLFFKLLG